LFRSASASYGVVVVSPEDARVSIARRDRGPSRRSTPPRDDATRRNALALGGVSGRRARAGGARAKARWRW
jgi:hypothetical protein